MELNETGNLPQWFFSEMKGPNDDDCNEADQISALSFDNSGNFLATGDKGGRVVIFKANEDDGDIKYDVYGTFTSHEAGFDYLKSVEIEEKINKIEWLPQINDSRCLLTTNDKVVKLWRVKERNKPISEFSNGVSCIRKLQSPSFIFGKHVESSCRKVFANAHAFNINSLSVNSDQETFLSSDELRINIWNLQHTDQSFNIVDLKPANMENLSEVITCAKFHPRSCSTFVYSLSKRMVRLCDMRVRALCDEATLQFTDDYDTDCGNKSFFSDIISSISDIQVSHSGHMLMARDYLSIKIWDMRQHNKPMQTFSVHDHFRAKLCSLYENDSIFDKFECSWSPDDKYIITGSYNNFMRQFNVDLGTSDTLEVSRTAALHYTMQPLPNKFVLSRNSNNNSDHVVPLDSLDYTKKLLHLCWHPQKPLIAIATTHNLYFLQNHKQQHSFVTSVGSTVEGSSTQETQQQQQQLQNSPGIFDNIYSTTEENGSHMNGVCHLSRSPMQMEVDDI